MYVLTQAPYSMDHTSKFLNMEHTVCLILLKFIMFGQSLLNSDKQSVVGYQNSFT